MVKKRDENINGFICSYNEISKIDCSYNRISKIDCSYNGITKIENLPETLHVFDCIHNKISKIENLSNTLQTFYCWDNQITKIENLPSTLQNFYCAGNPIEFVDNVQFNSINFTLKGYQAIKRIQKRMKRRYRKKFEAANIIQRGCHNWLWKPICNDGTLGINCRISIKELNMLRHQGPIME